MLDQTAVKFAVVREDAALEMALVEVAGARACLTVASGGCTPLALKHRFPSLEVHAFDLNPAQLAHAQAKAEAVARGEVTGLNVGDAASTGLSQCGAFESLFRVLRNAWQELVAPGDELERFFSGPEQQRRALLERWRSSRYWPAVFEVAFAEGFLHAMFGPDATRHAEPGSYPRYFQGVFERGLSAADAATNPFLEHVLLQRYLHPHPFLTSGQRLEVVWHHASLPEVPALERFGVVSLSNVFDWSEAPLVSAWAQALRALKPGSLVVYRQLNNKRDWTAMFSEHFESMPALSTEWTQRERALFYERVTVLRRR